MKITPDKHTIAADNQALAYLTVDVVDKDGTMVPDANNELTFNVSGGKLVGLDNGQEESAENYKSNQRAAFNGKALAIVQATNTPGPITVTVTSPGLLPQATTIFAGQDGVAPVYRRAPGYTVDHVAGFSTTVPVGTTPTLPGTVDVVYSDGVDRWLPVTWDALPNLTKWGRYTVNGTVEGAPEGGRDDHRHRPQHAQREPRAQGIGGRELLRRGQHAARRDARRHDDERRLVERLQQGGDGAAPGGQQGARVRVGLGRAGRPTRRLARSAPYFVTSASRVLPSSYAVTYWNGSAFVPVKNLTVTAPSTLSFDPVNTNQVRIEMTSPQPGTSTGFFQIAELEVNGELLSPTILGISVNGAPVPGFDPAVSSYGPIAVQYNTTPVITATPAADEKYTVALPPSLPGDATVTVTAADGSSPQVYTLHLIPADIHNGGVGGTVPATLALTLGPAATFGAFTPGLDHDYTANTTANVISTAGDATLSVSDPGHLTNGTFSLPSPLQVAFSKSAWSAPVSNDPVTITFTQHIGATDPLRTGSYSRTLTFTLSTTTP